MKLIVGEEYEFNYELLHNVVKFDDSVVVDMKDEVVEALQHRLRVNGDVYKQRFDAKKPQIKKLKSLVNRYERLVEARKLKGIRKVSQKEKDIQREIKKIQQIAFPKFNRTDEAKAQNLFIRFFDPQNISEGNGIKAIYGGKLYTMKGNVVHKWFMLNPADINRKYTEGLEKFLHFYSK